MENKKVILIGTYLKILTKYLFYFIVLSKLLDEVGIFLTFPLFFIALLLEMSVEMEKIK